MDSEELHLKSATPFAGRYILKRLLGSGGMGSVYLASDSMLANEQIAIKVLHAELCKNSKHTQRFLREVQLTRKVTHPNVVRTFDVGDENGRLFFTMEFAEGITLKERLSSGPIECCQAAGIVREICKGLFAIHQADIIHRDLKPGNIILTPDGFVKITDFGVAKPGVSDLTGHNEIIGSIPYMAPEVWVGRGVTAQADLYALGVVVYEMVTGVLPFEGDSPAEMMCKHLEQRPVPPKTLCAEIPDWLDALIMQLLEKDASHRPAGAAAVVTTVNRYLDADNTPLPGAQDELKLGPPPVEGYKPTVLDGFTDVPASLDGAPEQPALNLEIFHNKHQRHEYVEMPERWVNPDTYDYPHLSPLKRIVRHFSILAFAVVLCSAYVWYFQNTLTPWAQGLMQVTRQMQVMQGAMWAITVSFLIYAPVFAMPIFLLTAVRRNLAVALHSWLGASVLSLLSVLGVFAVFCFNLRVSGLRPNGSFTIAELLNCAESALVYSAELSLLIPQGTVFSPVVRAKTVLYEPALQPLLHQHFAYWVALLAYVCLLTRFIERKVVMRGTPSLRFKVLCVTSCGIMPVALQLAALQGLSWAQILYASQELRLVAGPVNHLFDPYSVGCGAINWIALAVAGCWVLPALSNRVKRFQDERKRPR